MKTASGLIASLVLATTGLLLAGCDMMGDHSGLPPITGIEGHVFRGPIHPGPVRDGENSEEGFAATFYVYIPAGQLVTTFKSADDGTYHAALAPGNYIVIPDASAPIINAKEQVRDVSVVSGKFTTVDLHFDTGLL